MEFMNEINSLDELENKYFFDRNKDLISRDGKQGIIYRINNFACKVMRSDRGLSEDVWSANRSIYENNIAVDLYNNSVSVPKPHGVFLINRVLDGFPDVVSRHPAFLMDFLEGYEKVNLVDGKYMDRIDELICIQRNKIRELGYRCYDFHTESNLMYSVEKDDLKVIDFLRYFKK